MTKFGSPRYHGIIHGIAKGSLTLIFSDFFASTFIDNAFSVLFVVAMIFSGVHLSLFVWFCRKNSNHLIRFYWQSQCAFGMACLLGFLNALSLHLSVFPHRELSNADGLVWLIIFPAYLVANEMLQILVLLIFNGFSKTGDSI